MKTGIAIGISVVLGLLVIQAATLVSLRDVHDEIDALEVELRSYIQTEVWGVRDFAASERRKMWEATQQQIREAAGILEDSNQARYNSLIGQDSSLSMRLYELRNWVSNNFYRIR